MTVMTAAEIARRCGGSVEGDAAARVDGWGFDSRALAPGSCFVALRDKRDGHDFVNEAFDAGARVGIIDHAPGVAPELHAGRALVHVRDTLVALQDVARSVRLDRIALRVVAVAGSTGKTSTKDLLAAVLSPLGCHANAESFNNEFGLPITLCNTPEAAGVVVTEMGERFRGDLALLCDIAHPQIAVVTNVGLAHAEHLGGLQGAADVLSEVLTALPNDGLAVLNADDDWTPVLATRTKARVVTVGAASTADHVVADVDLDGKLRASFTLSGAPLSVPLHGAHHVQNAAMAAVVAREAFDMPFDEIAIEMAAASSGRWRMELLETDDGITLLNDAYNANPTSMQAALTSLARLPVRGRRFAVLGEMRELGAHAADAHGAVGECAARLGVDVVVAVGEGGADIARAARVEAVADAEAAYEVVHAVVQPGDAVLCKASRAVGLERVADRLLAAHRRVDAAGAGGAQ